MSQARARCISVCLGLFALALGLRLAGGGLDNRFAGFEDEPAHFATALMARDYIQSPEPAHPIRYAEGYYAHHPKVGAGQWPPLLHGVVGVWMRVFGESRLAQLVVLCLVAALAGWSATRVVGRGGSPLAALAAGVLYLSLPLVQQFCAGVMAEPLVALLCTLAVLGLVRWLEEDDPRGMAQFGFAAVLAIYTKGNSLALALAPLSACLLVGRPRRLFTRAPLITGLAAGLCTAPWYLLTAGQAQSTWEDERPSFGYARDALQVYPELLYETLGPALILLALVGWVVGLRATETRLRWKVLTAWCLSWLVLHCVVPSSLEPRHLMLVLPVLCAAVASGADAVAGRAVQPGAGRGAVMAVLLAGALLAGPFQVYQRAWSGWDDVVARLQQEPGLEGHAWLVASDAAGEGMAVVEAALASPQRPGQVVLRGTKFLAESEWQGGGHEPVLPGPDALDAFLAELPIGVLMFDRSTKLEHRFPHYHHLAQMVGEHPEHWQLIERIDLRKDGELHPAAVELYVRRDLAGRSPLTATFELQQRGAGSLLDR